MIFMNFPVVTLLSVYCDCERLEDLVAQISRYTIAGCVFKLLCFSGFINVRKSDDVVVFDKRTCIIHS